MSGPPHHEAYKCEGIPTTVGPGGIQRVGIEFFLNRHRRVPGTAYIDQVTW
jgi:hypothetical protein